MSFYEQLCQLNDEDLPEIKWLETILDEMKPDRDEVCGFIVKLEGEMEERKQRLKELELEVRKQNRRIEFANDCKECLARYTRNKLAPHALPSSGNSFKPAVPPRTNGVKSGGRPMSTDITTTAASPLALSAQRSVDIQSPQKQAFSEEGEYLKLSDCFSARPSSKPPATPPKPAILNGENLGSSTVRLRRPLENAYVQNVPGRRHTFDEEKIRKRSVERLAEQNNNLSGVQQIVVAPAVDTKPEPEPGTEGYVNIEQFSSLERLDSDNFPTPRNSSSNEKLDGSVSTEALIDEQFGFLDNEVIIGDLSSSCSSSKTGSHGSTENVLAAATTNSPPIPEAVVANNKSTTNEKSNSSSPESNDSLDNKMSDARRSLIYGFISDQRDYVGMLETVVKYSKAIHSTLSSPKPDIINSSDFGIIFGLLPKIADVERLFIDRLEERVNNWAPNEALFAPLVGEKYAERLSLYGNYLRDYNLILETARRCFKESPKFLETCGEIIVNERKQGRVKKRFEDMLLLPIIRLQATGLALERIIEVTPPSHPDYSILIAFRQKLRTALDAPSSVPVYDGSTSGDKNGSGQKRQALRPAVALVEWVTAPTSKMAMLSVDSVRKLRYTFLFTDVLVACKRRVARNNRFQFEAIWWFPVSDLKLEDLPPAKADQGVKTKLEELSHEILLIRRQLLAISRGGASSSAAAVQEQRKRLQQLETDWLIAAPLVPLRLYNAESSSSSSSKQSPPGSIATTNDSKIILFLSDFELGDWKRAIHACQMRLMSSPSFAVTFQKDVLSALCNDVSEKMGINNVASSHPRVPAAASQQGLNSQLSTMSQSSIVSENNQAALSSIVASSTTAGIDIVSKVTDPMYNSMGHHQVTGQLLVTVHEMSGLVLARPCSVVLYVDCFGHFQIQAQTRLSESKLSPQWNEEFELDLNNSSSLRLVCYAREPDGRDVIVGQSALQLTPDWLSKPFVVQPIGLLAAASTDPHLSLTLTIRYRPPHLTIRRRHGAMGKGPINSVFGQLLADVVMRDGSETSIPRIVTECVRRIEAADGLDQEGLYRISGLVGEVKRVKVAFDKDISTAREQLHLTDVNVATGVLKSFFRELTEPLFTEVLSQDCYRLIAENSQTESNPDDVLQQAASIVDRLPKVNRKTAFFLLQHLCRVAERCDKNLMTAENLATIWGPTLLAPPAGTAAMVSASTIYLQGQVLLVFLHLVASGYKIPDS